MNKTLIVSLTALALLGGAVAKSHSTAATSSASMSGMSMAGTMKPAFTVNVNTATLAELEKVPGLGPKLSAEIIKMRPYKNQAELVKKVKGIGKHNILKFGPYFTY